MSTIFTRRINSSSTKPMVLAGLQALISRIDDFKLGHPRDYRMLVGYKTSILEVERLCRLLLKFPVDGEK